MIKQNKEKWIRSFEQKFVRNDGLMDKYYEDMFMAEAIIAFIKKVEAKAYKRGIEKGRGLKDKGISVRDVT